MQIDSISREDSIQHPVQHLPIKRLFDIVFSLLVLIVGAPLFLLIALLIRITSSGSFLYKQKRIGRGGIPFNCYKFRTMKKDADQLLEKLLKKDPSLKKQWKKSFKLENDPRVTWIGSFLRKTSLDELPQFWNVVKGDLSVVGPRPVIEEEIHVHYREKARKVLSIRPGITGLWQVSGRNCISYEKRVQLDERYVERRSFFLDIQLIVQTIFVVVSRRGAY